MKKLYRYQLLSRGWKPFRDFASSFFFEQRRMCDLKFTLPEINLSVHKDHKRQFGEVETEGLNRNLSPVKNKKKSYAFSAKKSFSDLFDVWHTYVIDQGKNFGE